MPIANPKRIGLVLAGNIPLVGFHDWLSVFLSGHHSLLKLSEKDRVLFTWFLDWLEKQNPHLSQRWTVVNKLTTYDAVIATGSNNSGRYFAHYFSHVPHLLRFNRNGVGVLTGTESTEELKGLARDVLTYFGLGCRSVAKVLIPQDYSIDDLAAAFDETPEIQENARYRNNYDYQLALALLNRIPSPYQRGDYPPGKPRTGFCHWYIARGALSGYRAEKCDPGP